MKNTFLSIGTGPGIGLATAMRFAKEGLHPVLAARNTKKLASLASEVQEATGKKPDIVELDAGNPEQIAILAKRYADEVAVLHYNAASMHAQSLSDAHYDDFERDVRVGVTGCLYAIKAFSPALLASQAGTILLTGGSLALSPMPQYLTLGIAKAGIRNIAQALFGDFAQQGVHIASIRVSTAVAPRSSEARDIADLFWKMHCQPKTQWTWEEVYGTR